MQVVHVDSHSVISVGPSSDQDGNYILMVVTTDQEQFQIVVPAEVLEHLPDDIKSMIERYGMNKTGG